MPRVALIEVGCSRPELNEPVGICTVAAYLAQENALSDNHISLFWQQIPRRRIAIDALSNTQLIGLSAQINSLRETQALYAQIRNRYPKAPIIIGNLLSIYAGSELLSLLPDAILCTGEGEVTFSETFRKVASGYNINEDRQSLRDVPGLMFLERGVTIRSQPMLANLAKVPIPRRDFTSDLVENSGITRIEGSRGCHWGRCEFCSVASRFGLGGYRRFSSDRLLADLENLARHGARSPYFSDEDFFGRRYSESREVASRIIEAKEANLLPQDMNFFVSVLASDVKHPEGQAALAHWKQAGLREVFVGIEAGAEAEIKRFAKKANSGTNTTALHRLLEMGFQVDIGFIMFDPMMTLNDLEQNVAWLQNQPLTDIDARVTKSLRIQPRTGLEEKYRSLVIGPLNVDELTFPTKFADPGVARIELRFRLWENVRKQDVYAMLGAGRGEIGEEDSRLKLKRRLARIRDIDIEYLRCLISHEKGDVSDDEVENLAQQLTTAKNSLIISNLAA